MDLVNQSLFLSMNLLEFNLTNQDTNYYNECNNTV